MPEALATTKRKFHRLLDSRFGPPTTTQAQKPGAAVSESENPQSTAASAEPATKRIRSGTSSLATTSSQLPRPNASSTSLARSPSLTSLRSTTRTNVSKTGATPATPTREPPNFAPWSHAMFLARLRTFGRVSQWHPKPEAVNEVEWAKRGWSCVDTNTVACKGGCGQRVLVDVEPVPRRLLNKDTEGDHDEDEEEGDDEEMEKALVERYAGLIIEGHSEGCLWRQAGCKGDIYRLPIVKTSVWQPELRERYKTLLKIPGAFEHTHLKPDDLKPGMEQLLADLPGTLLALPHAINDKEDTANADSTEEITPQARQHSLLIALTGWRGVTESGTDLLCCDACFQRIGLWMYQPDYKRPKFATITDASSTDNDDPEEQEDRSLDLVDLHREHCPWRNARSQCATGDYAGQSAWKIMHSILERYADEYRRRSKGQISRSRAVSEVVGTEIVVGDEREDNVAEELELMPELTREETEKADKERTSKLRRLKSVFGFNKARTVKRRESMLL